jgi:hypothetical protein
MLASRIGTRNHYSNEFTPQKHAAAAVFAVYIAHAADDEFNAFTWRPRAIWQLAIPARLFGVEQPVRLGPPRRKKRTGRSTWGSDRFHTFGFTKRG